MRMTTIPSNLVLGFKMGSAVTHKTSMHQAVVEAGKDDAHLMPVTVIMPSLPVETLH